MITTLLIISLVSSVAINILFVWYTRKLLNYLEMTNGEARSMLSSVAEYETHLNDVYGKDTFYGDPTLESLLERIADQIQEYVSANEDLTKEEPDAQKKEQE